MTAHEQKYLHSKFEDHIKTRGGIFTPATRHRLIGVRGLENNAGKPDTADFWQDVRDYTKAALRDLELLAMVAENHQLEDIFAEKYPGPNPLEFLNLLLRHEYREDWRTQVGIRLVTMGMEWRGMYSKKLKNKLITEAFDNAKAAAELLRADAPAAPSKARKRPGLKKLNF